MSEEKWTAEDWKECFTVKDFGKALETDQDFVQLWTTKDMLFEMGDEYIYEFMSFMRDNNFNIKNNWIIAEEIFVYLMKKKQLFYGNEWYHDAILEGMPMKHEHLALLFKDYDIGKRNLAAAEKCLKVFARKGIIPDKTVKKYILETFSRNEHDKKEEIKTRIINSWKK